MEAPSDVQDPSFALLATPRLVVRRFAGRDAKAFAAYRSEPDVARYQAWECPYPLVEAEKFVSSLEGLAPGTPGTWFQFAVGLAESGALVGDVALRTSRSDPRQAELGFTFASAHQRRGLAGEAVAAVLDYAFSRLAMSRVFSITDARNQPAQRLLERLAFRREIAFREPTWFKGAWASEVLYAKLASEHAPLG
jgi:RimJ/RimL family protein N-acetyltransferase